MEPKGKWIGNKLYRKKWIGSAREFSILSVVPWTWLGVISKHRFRSKPWKQLAVSRSKTVIFLYKFYPSTTIYNTMNYTFHAYIILTPYHHREYSSLNQCPKDPSSYKKAFLTNTSCKDFGHLLFPCYVLW